MIWLAAVDIVALSVNSFSLGILLLQGAVYCTYPLYNYVTGCIALGQSFALWMRSVGHWVTEKRKTTMHFGCLPSGFSYPTLFSFVNGLVCSIMLVDFAK